MLFKFRNLVISLVCATLALSAIPAVSAQKGAIGHVEASMLELAGPPSVDVEAADKAGIKGDPFAGLTHISRQDESTPVFLAIENQNDGTKPNFGPHVTRVTIAPNGTFTRTMVFSGRSDQEFVSLAVSGNIAFVTTMQGEVVFINMTSGENRTYNGLAPGVRYGLIVDTSAGLDVTEIGVYDTTDPQRLVHFLDIASGRYMRIEEPDAVAAGCATIMALGLRRVWDLDFRSSTGQTRRYLVVDGGNSGLAPRLLQVSYDFSTSASSVTVIATGPIGDNWFGGDLVGNDFYVATRAGAIKRIDVNTGNQFLVSATALDPNFYSDLIVRTEGGVRQIYSVGYQGYFRKTNATTGVTTLSVGLPGTAHSIALDSSGNSFIVTGSFYNGGFRAALWKVTTAGAVTLFAQGPAGGSFSFYGASVESNNSYRVINNMIGGVIRVNSLNGPWTVVCPSSGGQNQELIRDGSRTVLGDYSQGSIQFF